MEHNNNNDDKGKVLFLKRVSLNKNKNMQKDLNHFFWNVDNYFKKNYDKFDIVLGNSQHKKGIIPSFFMSFGKRRAKRTSTLKINNNNNSNSHDRKINESKMTVNSNTSRFGGKRGIIKNNKESGLKVGQKYITESELEDLFHAFGVVQNMNKKKNNHFIMAKDYIDNNILMANKTFSTFGKFSDSKKNQLIGYNKILPELSTASNKTLTNFKNTISNFNYDYNKSVSSAKLTKNLKERKDEYKNDIITSNNDQKFKMSAFMEDFMDKEIKLNEDKKYKTTTNFYSKANLLNFQNVKSRNNLVKRQNQYLSAKKGGENSDNKAINDYYAKLLADQEQVIVNTKKMTSKKKRILKYISKKSKKKEKNLLLKDLESYRVQNELKDKFCLLGAKLEPEHNYCWKTDLRGDLYKHKRNENNPNYFNIRDPYIRTINGSFSDKNLTKKKYFKYYKNIIEENDNINKNLQGLYIKGKNLLKMEYDQFKSIKNRKIINNYELYLPSSHVEDIIFIDKKYGNRNKTQEK